MKLLVLVFHLCKTNQTVKPFQANVPFLDPMKCQKTKVFLRLQKVKEWNKIGVNIAQQQHSRDVLKKALL